MTAETAIDMGGVATMPSTARGELTAKQPRKGRPPPPLRPSRRRPPGATARRAGRTAAARPTRGTFRPSREPNLATRRRPAVRSTTSGDHAATTKNRLLCSTAASHAKVHETEGHTHHHAARGMAARLPWLGGTGTTLRSRVTASSPCPPSLFHPENTLTKRGLRQLKKRCETEQDPTTRGYPAFGPFRPSRNLRHAQPSSPAT